MRKVLIKVWIPYQYDEIFESKRKEERRLKRVEILNSLQYDFTYNDLTNMPDEHFNKLVLQLENERDKKIAFEKEQEKIRIEEIRLNNIETERRIAAYEFKQFWSYEYSFREFTTSEFSELMDELKNKKQDYDKKQSEIAAENEKLKKAQEEKDAELEKERKKLADQKRIADEKLKKAQEEKDKLQKQIDDKKKADEKAKKDAELKAENEAKEKAELERKASIAPDKEKLTIWLNSISLDEFAPESIKPESVMVANDIMSKLEAFKNWALKQIETL